MSFQTGIGSLGGTMFFQVGLCTPLRTMITISTTDLLCLLKGHIAPSTVGNVPGELSTYLGKQYKRVQFKAMVHNTKSRLLP